MAGRPLLPSTGQAPDEQRLRSGLSELVRRFLDSGLFLQRFLPGTVLRTQTSATGQVLPAQWGSLNPVGPAVAVTVALPIPQAKNIGVPLPITKTSPTGVLYIKPTVGTDGRTAALLDGSATGLTVTRAGRIDLISDGSNWSSNVAGTGDGSTTVGTPSGVYVPASAWRLPATYSPIGLWHFNETLTDSSGLNQPKLVLERGSELYTSVYPGVQGVLCGGPTGAILRLPHTGVASLLRKPGDISVQFIGQMMTETLADPTGSSPIVSYRGGTGVGGGGNANNNSLWGMFLGPQNVADWWTEGGGAGSSAFVSSPVLPPAAMRTVLWGVRRQGNLVRHYLDGKPMSSGTATGVLPDGGASGLLRIGGGLAETAAPLMVLTSLKVTAGAMSDAEFLADYNASLGQHYGTRY